MPHELMNNDAMFYVGQTPWHGLGEKLEIEKMKLENNEDQAAERIRIADTKLKQTRDIAEAKLQMERMKRTAEDRRTKKEK